MALPFLFGLWLRKKIDDDDDDDDDDVNKDDAKTIPLMSRIPWKKILTIGGITLGILIPLIIIIVLLMKETKTV